MSVLQSERTFGVEQARVMTLGGTITATSILLSIVAAVGILTWQYLRNAYAAGGAIPSWVMPVMIAGGLGTLVVGFVIYKTPKSARVIAPLHAVLEGAFVGCASFYFPMVYAPAAAEGVLLNPSTMIAAQAALATVAVTAAMLLGYATGVLRVGPTMQKLIITAGAGVAVYVIALYAMRMFGFDGLWNGFADTGPLGIGFSGLMICLAGLFLLLDFKFIEEGVENGAPKYMEWVGAWGLMVTLVWLYIEILRLLAKLRSSD